MPAEILWGPRTSGGMYDPSDEQNADLEPYSSNMKDIMANVPPPVSPPSPSPDRPVYNARSPGGDGRRRAPRVHCIPALHGITEAARVDSARVCHGQTLFSQQVQGWVQVEGRVGSGGAEDA